MHIIDGVDLPGVEHEVFGQRLGEPDIGESADGAEKSRMCPANVHRHDSTCEEVWGIAVNVFAVKLDEEPWPQPGLLAVHVQDVIIAPTELEAFVQPSAGSALVVCGRANIQGNAMVAELVPQPTPVSCQVQPGIPRTIERRRL